MNFVGYARTLQGSFITLLAGLIVIGVLTALGFVLAKHLTDDVDDAEQWKTRVLFGTKIGCAIVIVFFLYDAMTLGFTDRMPRSDVNKQPVYDQMVCSYWG
jgi:ABC-type bacteriocin/lantibiotic exporter with double-glycine peptidase domain